MVDTTTPTHVTIPLETINRVLIYLGERPLKEVAQVFFELKNTADADFAAQQGKAPLAAVPAEGESS